MKKSMLALLLGLWCVPLCAQEIRLDSLWVKFGGYPVMAFSPDSRVIVLGSDILEPNKGAIRFLETQTGKQIDSMMKVDFIDFAFSPITKQLFVVERTAIKVYNSQNYSLERTMPYDNGGLLYFSPDGSILILTGEESITLVHSGTGGIIKRMLRPTEYNITPKETRLYYNGKVAFSNDGTKLYGKYEEQFGYWDLTAENTPFKSLFTIGNRAIIGFTPDKKYMVQQSNYIWDIEQKNQIDIPGRATYESQTAPGFATTPNGSCIVVTKEEDHSPLFVNPYQKRVVITNSLKYVLKMCISPDSNYFAYQYGNGQTHLHKIMWNTSHIAESEIKPDVSITPLPASDNMEIKINTIFTYRNITISISDIKGKILKNLYSGSLDIGQHNFLLNTSMYPSGEYFVIFTHQNSSQSTPFIIRK